MNNALVAAVVGLVAVTTGLGTCLALRAIPAEMPAAIARVARICGTALGAGLGSVLILAVLVQSAGLDAPRTVVLQTILAAALVGMVAEHAAASRRLRSHWLGTPGVAPAGGAAAADRGMTPMRSAVMLAAAASLCGAVLIPATLLDQALPRWPLIFGLASAGEGVGIALMAGRHARSGPH
jgi:hypothetical protein